MTTQKTSDNLAKRLGRLAEVRAERLRAAEKKEKEQGALRQVSRFYKKCLEEVKRTAQNGGSRVWVNPGDLYPADEQAALLQVAEKLKKRGFVVEVRDSFVETPAPLSTYTRQITGLEIEF